MATDTRPHTPPGRIEQALRGTLTGPGRSTAIEAMHWDKSQVSRFLDGSQGVTIDKLDALVESAGYVLVSTRYLDAVATLSEVGVHCECARQGRGECGPGRKCQ